MDLSLSKQSGAEDDNDSNDFQEAFNYFFHTNCTDSNSAVCRTVATRILKDSSFIQNRTKRANKYPVKMNISALDVCKQFVESLGNEASYAALHLNMMFESPPLKTLLSVYDSIVKYKIDYKLPNLDNQATNNCSCYLKGTRQVNIVIAKNEELGLFLDIDGRSGISFVTKIVEGGAVHRSGCIKEGDFILQINGIETKFKNIDELDELLTANTGGVISFLVESDAENLIHEMEFPYFCRALVDCSFINNQNMPPVENVLNFSKGDILEIYGYEDQSWLRARLIGSGTLINTDSLRNSAGDILFPAKEYGLVLKDPLTEENENTVSEKCGQSFEKLTLVHPCPGIIRCVLLVGPVNIGRNELKKKLISAFPHKYANVVPHTTRKRRNHEVDSVDYNFIDRIDMEQLIYSGNCIEHGEYNNNLYGTTYASIINIMEQGKVPVLNVNPKTILKLRNVTFKPLIIFVKPPDILTLKETRSQSLFGTSAYHFSDMDFKEMIANASHLQRSFGSIFDACVTNGVFDDAFADLCRILTHYETSPHFVPQKWVDWI